jgi:hypothetical protein
MKWGHAVIVRLRRGGARARSTKSRKTMQMIEFWIVRKGEDPWKVAPEVSDGISAHPDNGKCLFCGDGHEIGAVIAFCWREPNAEICTAGICVVCARNDDEKLAEMTQQEVFSERVERLLYIIKRCDELEAMGFIETVGIDPVAGSNIRTMTAKGRNVLTFGSRR